jgi:hypothetical protein
MKNYGTKRQDYIKLFTADRVLNVLTRRYDSKGAVRRLSLSGMGLKRRALPDHPIT